MRLINISFLSIGNPLHLASTLRKCRKAKYDNDIVYKIKNLLALRFQITLTFIATLFLTFLSNSTNAQSFKTESSRLSEIKRSFSFTPITEKEFRKFIKKNYNAPFVTKIADSTQLEKAFESIEKTYNDSEKELAKHDLCDSPKCLTIFKVYYPTLDLYLFNILDYHYAKASFVFASTNEIASGYRRFRGEYGVMSNDGHWVGLERQDADNFLQIEICKSSNSGVCSLFKFDFEEMKINEKEKTPVFWAEKNTIYIATREYDQLNDKHKLLYYSIKLE